MTRWLDRWAERSARRVARASSRRGFLARLGTLLVGASALPLLPVARAAGDAGAGTEAMPPDPGHPAACESWRYCGLDGFLCSCCGGSVNACPPGTEMGLLTWIGTCRNPADGKSYIISYNDCCGKTGCGNCLCNRNESDRPMYRTNLSNDINWCMGTDSLVYHCTTAIMLGVAIDEQPRA